LCTSSVSLPCITEAGWTVQSRDQANITAGRGVAIREFPLKSGYGEADYLFYVDAIPAGVVEEPSRFKAPVARCRP